jgi:hypothetical protein
MSANQHVEIHAKRECKKRTHHICLIKSIEVLDRFFVQFVKDFRRGRLIDFAPIQVCIRFRTNISHNPLVFGRASGEFTGVNGEGITVFSGGYFALVVFDFVLKKLPGGVSR